MVTVGLRYSFLITAPALRLLPPRRLRPRRRLPRRLRRRMRQQFIVYFPFDQYVLTPEAQTVISEAANYANAGHATRVIVVGHTDTSGSPAYNVRLSERRAKAVADALVGQGVERRCTASGLEGETQLAVSTRTAPRTSEPPLDDRHQLLSRSQAFSLNSEGPVETPGPLLWPTAHQTHHTRHPPVPAPAGPKPKRPHSSLSISLGPGSPAGAGE